eukprot:scaffold561168_cov42-Prasinocladus_malaysianus.AAC.1
MPNPPRMRPHNQPGLPQTPQKSQGPHARRVQKDHGPSATVCPDGIGVGRSVRLPRHRRRIAVIYIAQPEERNRLRHTARPQA